MDNINNPYKLNVSENRRFLVRGDGSPFFWLADTGWELFRLFTREEARFYMQQRVDLGFNVIQVMGISEFEGLTSPNPYGRTPFKRNESGQFDPGLPDVSDEEEDYWDHVDYIIDLAETLGMYIAFLPTWGDKYHVMWGKGPVIFNGENARVYGEWLGRRYRDKGNIIWVLGGDRPLYTRHHFEVIQGMAEGLKAGDQGNHLMTFHPMGGESSSRYVHDENWLGFNMIQSGHLNTERDNYKLISEDYDRLPIKPVLDGEPCYEEHPKEHKPENGFFDASDVRRCAYYAVFAGAFGHSYGHVSVWSKITKKSPAYILTWQEALESAGASHMRHLRSLMESRPFLDRVPDQRLLTSNYGGANHMQATRGKDYAFIYSPHGMGMSIQMGLISGEQVRASWYDPKTGKSSFLGLFHNTGIIEFTPPASGRAKDWVLILDDAAAEFN